MDHPLRSHNQALADAFDQQAEPFERAEVQTDPVALSRLLDVTALPSLSRILDVGCGPGLVAEAFLEAGHRVIGIDLSAEMIARAERRCARFGNRASFRQASVYDGELDRLEPFDATVSRSVLHHIEDPLQFVARQSRLVIPGGVLVICDHTTDPDPEARYWHQTIERLRDRTHTANVTPGEMADLLANVGLEPIYLVEHSFRLDFDEWFDRGTPTAPKEKVRQLLRSGQSAHGFHPIHVGDGKIQIDCWRTIARGTKPGE